MHGKTLFLLIFSALVLLLLTSCSTQQTATPTASPSPTLIPVTPTQAIGCSVITAKPTPNVSSSLPALTSADFVTGPDNASVTMLFYCDFQSQQCQIFANVLDSLQKNHPNDLRVAFRPLPATGKTATSVLDKSLISVQAALAAGDQGKFWDMRGLLHTKYSEWVNLSNSQFETWVEKQAPTLGLDTNKFKIDLKNPSTVSRTKALYDAAVQLGISGIPTVFINGALQQRAALSYDGLESTISLITLGTREFNSCPPFDIDPLKQYTATIHMDKGDILIQLYADKAPLAVNSFVFLARKGWFDGVTFHRVIPGYLAQTGDPSGTGLGGPGYFFKNEINPDLQFDKPGVVGMANSGTDTNGSQFFITYAPAPTLDGGYTIFGQVLKGMDVLEGLTPRDPSQSVTLPPGDKITSVTIEEK